MTAPFRPSRERRPGKSKAAERIEETIRSVRGRDEREEQAKAKKGSSKKGTVSKEKAKKILKDDEVRGKPLTKKQKGFFGARAGGQPVRTVRS